MSNPKISVLVPVYNVESYLEACLNSLSSQTFRDFEVICVDDGSTDSSPSLLDSFAENDARFKVFHRENGGVSSARNFAIEQACGDYLVFVDSDDYVEPNTFEKLNTVAARDNSDIIVFGGESFPHVPWIEHCFNTPNAVVSGNGTEALLNEIGSYPLMCNKMYRRSLIVDNGIRFCEELKLGEDNAFQFTVFPYAHTVSFISDLLYHYRCDREDSAISEQYENRSLKVQKHLKVIDYVFENWKTRGILDGRKKELLQWAAFFLMDDLGLMDFSSRVELGKRFKQTCENFGLTDALPQMDEFGRQACQFIWGELYTGENPKVSVIYVYDSHTKNSRMKDVSDQRDGYISLVNQFLQDIELILVPTSSGDNELPAGFDSDPRCISANSFEEALQQARSDYVLITSPNYHYDGVFLDQMRKTALDTGADIAACLEYGGTPSQFGGVERVLKTRNCGTYPEYDCAPTERLYTFGAGDIPDYIGSAITCKLVDKLFRKDYLTSIKNIDYLGLTSWEAMCSAEKIAFLPYRYFSLLTFDYKPETVQKWAKSQAACTAAFLEAPNYRSFEHSWEWSAVDAFAEAYDRIQNAEAKLAFAKSAKAMLEESGCFDKIANSSYTDPRASVRFGNIFNSEADSVPYDDLVWFMRDSRGRIEANEAETFWYEVQHYEFHHSISYKVGRIFIDPVKKCMSMISRTKRKDMDVK